MAGLIFARHTSQLSKRQTQRWYFLKNRTKCQLVIIFNKYFLMALDKLYILTIVMFSANILVNWNPQWLIAGFYALAKSAPRWKFYLILCQFAVRIGIYRILPIYKYLIPVRSLRNRSSEIKLNIGAKS